MAHFSFLSNTTDHDKGVDRILSQATDLVVLEQTAAINLSGVVSDSDLEARFRRLKAPISRPGGGQSQSQNSRVTSAAKSLPTKPNNHKANTSYNNSRGNLTGSSRNFKVPDRISNSDPDPSSKCRQPRSNNGHIASSSSSNRSSGDNNRPRSGEESKKNGVGGSGGTRRELGGSDFRFATSPPKTTGCLWWSSPKSKSSSGSGRKKEDEFGWESTEEALKDLGSLSVKEQRQILRRAMEQQRKISREAEKIVKLAKPASSARKESGR